MEPGSTPPNGSAPATPGTPAPLFSGGGSRVDSLSYERKSMPRCKCLPLPAVEGWGVATHTCVVEIPAPDVSLTRKVGELAGIAVGAAVTLNILVAGPTTGGSMNPVRTLGPAVAAGNYRQLWIYLLAPTLGALTGASVYTAVKLRDENGETPRTQRSFRR